MIWILISGVVLIALGMFAAGVASGPWVKGACRSLNGKRRSLPLFRPHAGHHVPAHAAALTTGAAASVLLANRNAEALGFPARIALTPQEHADAMRELAEPYLPPSPAGDHPYPPYVPAWMPVERKQTEDHAPWTGSQPVLTDEAEAAERRRVDLIRSQLPENEKEVTREDMERALASLRALPVYGEAPQDAVDEAQRVIA